MKIVCVVLNYNDASTTVNMVQSVCGYNTLDGVVIVDNASTDDSWQQLKVLAGGNIHVIRTKKNGGYGYGNNAGIHYACEKLQATHVLVANPDVEVSENCIRAMQQVLLKEKRCAMVSAMVVDAEGNRQLSSWKIRNYLADLLDTGLITRRLFRRWLEDRSGSQPAKDRAYVPVDAVPGSLFLADARILMKCGLYDEHVFLYYEEKILGKKLKDRGYQTMLLTGETYVHRHSVSINKSVASIWKRQALQHESKLYYYKKYLHLNRGEMLLSRIVLSVIMAEIWFLTRVLHMRW